MALGEAILKAKALQTIILKDNALTDAVGQILNEASMKKRNIRAMELGAN